VVINDWHYECADPTAPDFAATDFSVVACPWKLGESPQRHVRFET